MRHLALSLSLALVLAGCSGGGGGDAQAVPTFTGKPRTFNGDWTGPGRAYTDHYADEGLTFTVYISKTPEGADLFYNIRQPDGSLYAMGKLVDHYVVGNTLYSYGDKKPAGTIGSDGFTVEGADTGRFIVTAEAGGQLHITGHLQFGPSEVQVEASLKPE